MKKDISIKSFWFKLPKLSQRVLIIGGIFLFTIGFYFLINQIQHPLCCEASMHLKNALTINSDGIDAVEEPLRTFVYPWLLSVLVFANQGINLPIILLVFVMQISVYYLAVFGICHLAKEYSIKLSETIYLALCANFFVIPYFGVTLPDSLHTSISILLITWIMLTETQKKLEIKWIFIATLLLSLTITIHPSAIWLIVPVSYCWVRLLWRRSMGILSFFLGLLLGGIPLYIQIIMNSIDFNTVSLFPLTNLGNHTIKLGIENIKYVNWLGKDNFYSSANLINLLSGEHSLSWYFDGPIDSLKLLIFKLIGAFDFDYLIPYPRHLPFFKWLPSFFSFTVLWAGIFGVLFHLFTKNLVMLGSRFLPVIIFVSWSLVSLLPAVELRFTLPLISYFIIVGCATVNFAIVQSNRKLLWLMIAGWIIFMPVFFWMANFIRLQNQLHG